MKNNSHDIQADIDYVGAFLFESTSLRHKKDGSDKGVDPAEIVEEAAEAENDSDLFSPQPPPVSGYRCPSDIQGIACWNCAHFLVTGDDDNDGVVDGICNLFEAHADGAAVCDRFTAHADLLRQSPHTSWQEDQMNERNGGISAVPVEYSDNAVLNEIHLAATDAVEEDGLVWKDILRTGEWTHTPTVKGVIKRPLRIVEEGETDPIEGIISLSEIYNNFNDNAVPYVTVPLSDDDKDHKNIARVNTGFVRKLKLVKREDGKTVLRAGIDFTEPDVKGKVLRGTIPDVSAGIPFGVTRRSDNRVFGAVLDHVCLTRKPFVDGLGPFGIAAADGDEIPTESFEEGSGSSATPQEAHSQTSEDEGKADKAKNDLPTLSFKQTQRAIREALSDQLHLGPDYRVDDVMGNTAIIQHASSKAKWKVAFRIEEDRVVLDTVDRWTLVEEEKTETTATESMAASDIQEAQNLRELRLSQPTSEGEMHMSRLTLDGVELSDLPETARARIQSIVEENEKLSRRNRETQVSERLRELEGLGLKDRPGALKLYRSIMLSDDDGPAVVLFSDSDDEEKKERLTATQILDRFIDALKADGGVQLSDQHLASGNDTKPPLDPSREQKPLEERVKEQQEAIYGKSGGRRYRLNSKS